MFELNADDKLKFEQYEKIFKSEIPPAAYDDMYAIPLSGAMAEKVKSAGLTDHAAAYSFVRAIAPSLDRTKPEYQRILGLALEFQRDRMGNLNASEQRLLYGLQTAWYNRSNQEARVAGIIYEVVGAGASLGCSGIASPIKKIGINALALLFGKLGNTDAKGMGPDILKKYNKLEAKDFLREGSPLNLAGLQYVQYREALRKQTQTIFNQYHFDINTLDPALRHQLDEIIEQFKVKSQRESFEKGFNDAKEVFSKISQLGQATHNPVLSAIGAIGGQGVSIAYNIAHLAGAIPGLAAPTGLGMLLPGANIAFSALALFSMLANSSDEDNGNGQALQEALKAISEQIKALHEEMRKHFKHMDQRLIKIHKDLLSGLEDLQRVVRSDIKSLKAAVLVTYEKLETDINHLQEITEKGLIELRLDDYRKLLSSSENYVSGGDSVSAADAKDKLIEITNAIEKNWLLGNLSSDMLNSGWHYSADEKKRGETYRKVVKISDYVLNKNVALLTGYLAKVAKETLGIKDIPAVLPNIELFAKGVKHSLVARTYLEQHHQHEDFDTKGERLKEIRQLAQNTVQFVDVIAKAPTALFKPLFAIYTDGVKALEEKVKQVFAEKQVIELTGKKCPLLSIKLPDIQPVAEQKDNPILDVTHLLGKINPSPQNLLEIPAILREAQKWGVIDFALDYKGERSQSFKQFPPDSLCRRNYDVYPAMPNYHITMRVVNFSDKTPLKSFLNQAQNGLVVVDFKSNLPGHQMVARLLSYEGGETFDQYIARQNNLSLKDLCGKNWLLSSKQSEAKVDEKFFDTRPGALLELSTEMASRKLNAAKKINDEAKSQLKQLVTQQDKDCFKDQVSQLKAARSWIIAYCRLLGVPAQTVAKLAKDLVCDFEEFIQDPGLFDAQNAVTNRCLEEIKREIQGDEKLPASVSPVRLKASDIIHQIDHFHQRQINGRMASEEKRSKQASIDHSELLKPYHDMHRRWDTQCTTWLDSLGDEAKRNKNYASCKASFKTLTELLDKLDQTLSGRNRISEDVVKVFESLYETGLDVHDDLCTLNVFSAANKEYKLDIDRWKNIRLKENVIKMLKELSRVSSAAKPKAADAASDIKDEKSRPPKSAASASM